MLPVVCVELRKLLGSLIAATRKRIQERQKSTDLTIKSSIRARFARALFNFCTFRNRPRPFKDMKLPVLQLCGQRERLFPSFFVSYIQTAHTNLILG